MGTLTVQTLQAPTSGANANKVLIPSGHNLLAAGHVVQTVQYTEATDYSSASTSPAQAAQTGTFTLNNSSNKVLVTANFLIRGQGSSSVTAARSAIYRGTVASGTKIRGGSEPQFYTQDGGTEQYLINCLQFLDTPSASSTTYSIGFWRHSSSGNVHIYGSFFNTTIIMQEIAQ